MRTVGSEPCARSPGGGRWPRRSSHATHDLRGAEEVRADDILWAARRACDGVDIQRGRVGPEQGAGTRVLVDRAEDLLFDRQLREDRLHHDVSLADRLHAGCPADESQAPVGIGFLEPTAAHARCVVRGDTGQTAVEILCAPIDQRHRDPGIRQCHRDPAAHRPGTNDRGVAGAPVSVYLWQARYVTGRALRLPHMLERGGLGGRATCPPGSVLRHAPLTVSAIRLSSLHTMSTSSAIAPSALARTGLMSISAMSG